MKHNTVPEVAVHDLYENASSLYFNKTGDGRPASVIANGWMGSAKTAGLSSILVPHLEEMTGKKVTLIIERPYESDALDYKGIPFPVKSDIPGERPSALYTHSDLAKRLMDAVKANPDGIILLGLDEFDKCDHAMQKILANGINEGEFGGYKLPPNVWIWGTANLSEEGTGSSKMLTHLANRVGQYEVYLDPDYWIKNFAIPNGMLPGAIAWIEQNKDRIRKPTINRDGPSLTARSFTYGTNALKALKQGRGDTDPRTIPDDGFALSTLAGWIGMEAATQFMAIAPVMDKLPRPRDIFNHPDTTAVPEGADFYLQFPLQSLLVNLLLAETTTPDQQVAALEYTSRLSPDLASGVFAIVHDPRAGRTVLGSPKAQAFIAKHASLFTAIASA